MVKITEDMVLQKAMDILFESLEGRTVNPIALNTAQSMTMMFWSSVYQERLKKEQIKEALREVWSEQIETKDNGQS